MRRVLSRALAASAIAVFALAGAVTLGDGVRIKGKAVIAQVLLERAWARTLESGTAQKPWPWADIAPAAKIYAPRLDVSTIALTGVSGEAMAFGPGVMEGAPQPGAPGLSIIAAHRDTHFRFLKDIKIGDEFTIANAAGETFTFVVDETRIVDAARSGLTLEGGPPRTALVTCWPFDARMRGEKRFVAIGVLKGEG